ncbi:MAG: succinylglutamate desuccinylase/aspartoacylase family protein [Tatlockia sp.]|nr:succinylglutamate desuccinylase/aspartoacylase family protein [Tatlockia sp.]
MKNSNLIICDATIQPGESANLALPLPEHYSCASFYIPIKVVHGKEAGPCLIIIAGIKGNELNGIEIINRLLSKDQLKSLKGTLIAIPVLNVLELINYPSSAPYEKQLEFCFPGDKEGSYCERVAEVFTKEIFAKATHCIEIKTGSLNHELLPQIYADLDNSESKKLAKCFSAPVITHIGTKSRSLSNMADELNIPMLVYKAGEALRFDESSIKVGIEGVLNVLSELEMISDEPDEPDAKRQFTPVFSQEQEWLRAHRSGVLIAEVELGQMIKKNQIIARIRDPFSADIIEPIYAPQDCVVVGINRNPLIYEGQSIFKVSSFVNNDRAEISLESWVEMQETE